MFYIASKVLGYLLQPSVLLISLLVIGLLLLFTRFQKLAKTSIAIATIGFVVIAFTPLGYIMLAPLEYRIARSELPKEVDGIVVLGGAFDSLTSSYHHKPQLWASAERVIEGVVLARKFPNAKLLYSGGHGNRAHKIKSEADIAGWFFDDLGTDRKRVLLESKARNTHENALFSLELAAPKSGETWLLVTSAFHMPRSVGIFRKAGWNDIKPWPVDFRTRGLKDWTRISSAARTHIAYVDVATREYIGLLAYWMTGRIDDLFPGDK